MKFNALRESEKSFSETNKQTKNRPYMIVKAEDEFTNLLFNKVIMDWLGGKLLILLYFSVLLALQGRIQEFFWRRGALVSCSTSTAINHIAFFGRIPVVLENRRPSQGGGAHPLHPPPRSAPALSFQATPY